MPFGKFAGHDLEDLPTPYVVWLLTLDDLREPLASAVYAEAARRGLHREAPARSFVPTLVAELIDSGFRTVALRAHPDRGGSNEAMRDAIAARDYLRSLVGAPR